MNEYQYTDHLMIKLHQAVCKMLSEASPDLFSKPMTTKEVLSYASTPALLSKIAPKISSRTFGKVCRAVDSLQNKLDTMNANQFEIFNLIKNLVQEVADTNSRLRYLEHKQIAPVSYDEGPHYTLGYILEVMLKKKDIVEAEKIRKKNTLVLMFKEVNLTLDNTYDEFYKPEIISNISDYVRNKPDIKGDSQRKYIRYLTEFIKTAHILDRTHYKEDLIDLLPRFKKTLKSEKIPHQPYSEDQLLKMFDSTNPFFKDNPDLFWICMVALFTGARQNAACTLQYQDICIKEGIQCIHFTKNHPIKQLKNEATERYVPINKQLLDLGFVDYVNRKKNKINAADTDFICPDCQTKGGCYNNKLITRGLTPYWKELGIKQENHDGYDFHSFRKNASLIMQAKGIEESYINDIIGWEGQTIMTKSYSNHTIQEIHKQVDRFCYDYLQPAFDQWKIIMAQKT